MTYANCKKERYFAFSWPLKYNNKIRKIPQKISFPSHNSENKSTIQNQPAIHIIEFAGYTH